MHGCELWVTSRLDLAVRIPLRTRVSGVTDKTFFQSAVAELLLLNRCNLSSPVMYIQHPEHASATKSSCNFRNIFAIYTVVGKAEKALDRLKTIPRDFSWSELEAIMGQLGYALKTSGGSGRKFIHPGTKATLMLHEPHPGSILKVYQVRDVLKFLRQENHL